MSSPPSPSNHRGRIVYLLNIGSTFLLQLTGSGTHCAAVPWQMMASCMASVGLHCMACSGSSASALCVWHALRSCSQRWARPRPFAFSKLNQLHSYDKPDAYGECCSSTAACRLEHHCICARRKDFYYLCFFRAAEGSAHIFSRTT